MPSGLDDESEEPHNHRDPDPNEGHARIGADVKGGMLGGFQIRGRLLPHVSGALRREFVFQLELPRGVVAGFIRGWTFLDVSFARLQNLAEFFQMDRKLLEFERGRELAFAHLFNPEYGRQVIASQF